MISLDITKYGIFKCPECDRVFNIDDEMEAQEWFYGHDCFIEE